METVDYLEAIQQVEKSCFAPLYVLLGSGFFLREKLVSALADKFLGDDGECIRQELQSAGETAWEKNQCSPLFATRRLLYFQGLHRLKPPARTEFLQQVPPPCPDDIILLEYAEEENTGLTVLEGREGFFVKEPLMGESRLRGFISRSFAARGKEIDPQAVDYLVVHARQTLEFLIVEIEKIALFAESAKKVTREMATTVLYPTEEGAAFDLVDAVTNGQIERALEQLSILIGRDRGAVGNILFLLFRQFRLLLSLADVANPHRADPGSLAQKLSVHPFVIKKCLAALHRPSREQAIQSLAELAAIDTRLKRGGEDPALLLANFIVRQAASKLKADPGNVPNLATTELKHLTSERS